MITTSTGAKKLESSDNWREIFPNPGTSAAGAHNASVDAADRIQPEIAPIINGKQCALGAASGDYVLLRNSTIAGKSDGAYIAAKAIPAATDIDSTYLGSAITGGIVNELNSNLTALSNDLSRIALYNMVTESIATSTETSYSTVMSRKFTSPGKFVVISLLTSDSRVLGTTTVTLEDFLVGNDNFVRYITDSDTKVTLHCRYYKETNVKAYITNSDSHRFAVKMFSVGDPVI